MTAVLVLSACVRPGSTGSVAAPVSILGWAPGITRGVPLYVPLSVYFSHDVNKASVERSWKLTPHVPGTFRWSGTAFSFLPSQSLQPNSYYRMSLGGAVRDTNGQPLANPFNVAFTTGDPLKVTSVTPASGTVDVPLNGLISLSFNHPIVGLAGLDAHSGDPPGWHVDISPATPGHGSWLGTSTWVFHPDGGLIPASGYHVMIHRTVHDAWGETLASDRDWTFHTAGPQIVNAVPGNQARYVDPNGSVTLTFNQPMDQASTAAAFTLYEAGIPKSGTVTWQGNSLVFSPRDPFTPGAQYQVSVAPSALSANHGATLGRRFVLSFRAAPRPRMVSAKFYGNVEFHFSAPMRQHSLDTRLTVTPPVPDLSTNIYGTTYNVTGSFLPSTAYTVTIDRGAQDRFGRTVAEPSVLHFTTPPLPASVSLRGRPGYHSAVSFSAGRVISIPVDTVNVRRVHYTLIRVRASGAVAVAGGCGATAPTGTTIRSWTESVNSSGAGTPLLNHVQHSGIQMARPDGSPLSPGVYWLGATIPSGAATQAGTGSNPAMSELIVVSNVGITLKTGAWQTLIWVTSARTGLPLPHTQVRLFGQESAQTGRLLGTLRTDNRGVILAPRAINERWAAVVDDGRHFGMVLSDWTTQSGLTGMYSLNSPYSAQPGGTYAYTDRPIYRPGQQVHFRAVLWRDDDARYSLLGSKLVHVQGYAQSGPGGGGNPNVYAAKLRLDRFGSVHGEFRLSPKAATGTDGLNFSIDLGNNQSINAMAQFTVAEYRKPEFLTTISAEHPHYVQGQTVAATVQVRYVFGAPVAGQRVTWTASTRDRQMPPVGWEQYFFGDQDAVDQRNQFGAPAAQGQRGAFGVEIAHGDGVTDQSGRMIVHLPIDLTKQIADQTITIEATVTDINHQPVSGRTQVTAHKSAVSVGLLPNRQVVPSGHSESVDVAAVTERGGAPLSTATPLSGISLTATVYRRTYTSVLSTVRTMSGFWQQIAHDRSVFSHTLTTDTRGRTHFVFTPREGGQYRVVVEATDRFGNRARSATSIYASAAGFSDFGQVTTPTMTLKPDKAQYRVGDTAHVLVAAPFGGATALITFERGKIRDVRVQHLRSNSSVIDVPVVMADIPNVYVAVTVYRGWRAGSPPDWRYGVANLRVQINAKRIEVRLSQDRPRYRPGDTVTYTVSTMSRGAPGATPHPISAEVSLALVDTAVLALQDDTNGNIVQALYGERMLGTSTSSSDLISIDRLVQGQSADVGPLCGIGGGGGGTGGLSMAASGLAIAAGGTRVRRHFEDTAFWRADVVTNDNGTATVRLHLPDNLTTWQLDARAVTADQRVGRQTLRTLSTQELLLRPVTPRFFLEGDQMRVGTVVNNTRDHSVAVDVAAQFTGLSPSNAASKGVTVPAHGEALLLWPVQVLSGSAASLTIRAKPAGISVAGDAVSVDLPVHPPLTDETVATSGQVFQSIKQLVLVPPTAKNVPGALTVQVSSSLTAGLGGAYAAYPPAPNPSNEDLANRILGAAALRTLPVDLTGLPARSFADLRPRIDDAVATLAANQLGDGGWPWYNDNSPQSDPAISADVIEALQAVESTGGLSPAYRRAGRTALQRGRQYLRSVRHYLSRDDLLHVLSVLAITGDRDGRMLRNIERNTIVRAHLQPAPLADLAVGLDAMGHRSAARSVVAVLESQAVVSATGAHWEGTAVEQGPSATATTAAVLAALLRVTPESTLIPAAARWLMLTRQGGTWDCFPVTAHALAALATYARAAREGKAAYRYQVTVDNRTKLAGALASDSAHHDGSVNVSVAALHHRGESTLVIQRVAENGAMGSGPLYYVAQLQYFLPATAIQSRSEGISVSRRYLSLSGTPVSSEAAGTAVKVELTIRTEQTLQYLHVDDPIPAGFEPIDQTLKTSRQAIFPAFPPFIYGGSQTTSLQPYLVHTDLRDDHVSLFAISLPPGTYLYTYIAQATTTGHYEVAPTHAEEAFFPEVFGRGAGQSFTVR